jgi:hypothetical protein
MTRRRRTAPEPPEQSDRWRSRIVEQAQVAPGDLAPHPNNWRLHSSFQGKAMAGVLREVGWVQDVIVNRRTGRILDGHLRVQLAIENGEPSVPVAYVDVSEDEEALILATFDPLGSMAATAGETLAALMLEVETNEPAVRALLDDVALEADEFTLEAPGGAVGGPGRHLGDPERVVKAVVYTKDLELFEEALSLTGLMNRGDAVAAVCREYVEKHQAR